MKEIIGRDKVFFGTRKQDKAPIYISKPSWDCGWYWGFGYLGNAREHYHLRAYNQKDHYLSLADGTHKSITEWRNISMYDALLADYELTLNIRGAADKFGQYPRLYTFCELVFTAYALKETAEVLGRGGSHMTENPCAAVIKNPEEVARINEVVLPAVFQHIQDLIEGKLP